MWPPVTPNKMWTSAPLRVCMYPSDLENTVTWSDPEGVWPSADQSLTTLPDMKVCPSVANVRNLLTDPFPSLLIPSYQSFLLYSSSPLFCLLSFSPSPISLSSFDVLRSFFFPFTYYSKKYSRRSKEAQTYTRILAWVYEGSAMYHWYFVVEATHNNENHDMPYLDFGKAFSRVSHQT